MKPNHEQAFTLINQGESETVEFKTRLINEKSIAHSLIAFANSKGGHLFIGVSNEKHIIGLSDNDVIATKRRIQKVCESLFIQGGFSINTYNLNNQKVVHVYVEPNPMNFDPVVNSEGQIFIRQGASDIKVSLEKRYFGGEIISVKSKREITGFVAMSFRDEEEPGLMDYYNAMLRATKLTNLPINLTRIDLN